MQSWLWTGFPTVLVASVFISCCIPLALRAREANKNGDSREVLRLSGLILVLFLALFGVFVVKDFHVFILSLILESLYILTAVMILLREAIGNN